MIKTINLTKYYADNFLTLDSLNLEVKEGELFGLIGPNGAGKTTTIKILCCLLKPSFGEVLIDGISIEKNEIEVKKKIGYLAEGISLYEDLTPRQYLRFFGKLYDLRKDECDERAFKYLKNLEISERINSKIGNLSKGMQKKVAIVRALIHDPKLLIWDEPTAGLDPLTANFIRDFMKKLVKEEGKTVFFSTHYLHEAEVLCDRVAILNKGKLITEGKILELKEKFNSEDLDDILIKAIKR
jgi:ABC-2 type transport system ATP-binding protein